MENTDDTMEPGGLQSVKLQRVGHDWVTEHTAHTGGDVSLIHAIIIYFKGQINVFWQDIKFSPL